MTNFPTRLVAAPIASPQSGYGDGDSEGQVQTLPEHSAPTNVSRVPESDTAKTRSGYDRSTEAALAFLNADFSGAMQLKHLLRILSNACGRLFLSERGMTKAEAKDEFLRDWLLQELSPFQNEAMRCEAARDGQFRYLANRSRYALIDELRRRSRSEDALDRDPSRMDEPLENNEGEDGYNLSDRLSVGDGQTPACSIGKTPGLEPAVLLEMLEAFRDELTLKLGDRLFNALSAICRQYPDQLSRGDVTRGIAAANNVSQQSARKLHRDLESKLHDLRGDPILRRFFELLSKAGEFSPTVVGHC